MNVTVVGTGYVGTVTGACLAYLGHDVICVDLDEAKINKLKRGVISIYEPGLAELIKLSANNLTFTTDLKSAVVEGDVIIIAVGTPALPSGESDTQYIKAAAISIGEAMDKAKHRVVVTKSTVPIGCGVWVDRWLFEGAPWDASFSVASNPEFLREGSAVHDSLFPDRIVLGANDEATMAILRGLYEDLVNQEFDCPEFLDHSDNWFDNVPVPVFETTVTSAETIKYAANSFLAMKIGFANEMANICEKVGADVEDVMRGMGSDSRIGPKFLRPGLGWGGSCFGKDVHSLIHTATMSGYEPLLLNASVDVNRRQRDRMMEKLRDKVDIHLNSTIAILGLAFKPDTDDLRDAPALEIIRRLLKCGAIINVYDPIAMPVCYRDEPELNIRYCGTALEAVTGADAVLLITEWKEFVDLDLKKVAELTARPILIDGRNCISPEAARDAGLDYTGFGR